MKILIVTARKRSLGQGNIFTPVCHSVHRGGVHGCSWGDMRGCSGGACVVAQGGVNGCSRGACVVAPGGMHGCSWGGMRACSGGACVLAPGGVHGFIWGGMQWFYLGGMHGFIQGVCMVLFGGHAWFFSVFFGYNEIRSMSGRYASYWNAFLFEMPALKYHICIQDPKSRKILKLNFDLSLFKLVSYHQNSLSSTVWQLRKLQLISKCYLRWCSDISNFVMYHNVG